MVETLLGEDRLSSHPSHDGRLTGTLLAGVGTGVLTYLEMTSPDGVRSGRVVSEVSVEQVGEDSLADQGDHVADRSAVPVAEPVVGPGTMVGLPGGSRAGVLGRPALRWPG
jgi:hypothetical protein